MKSCSGTNGVDVVNFAIDGQHVGNLESKY